ncbi:MAG: hypothetical protein HOE90_24625 [Bacteriovoracaceae bacterium]|nr:hypothetical protein [Bacteriovoracaceae bacterium]
MKFLILTLIFASNISFATSKLSWVATKGHQFYTDRDIKETIKNNYSDKFPSKVILNNGSVIQSEDINAFRFTGKTMMRSGDSTGTGGGG